MMKYTKLVLSLCLFASESCSNKEGGFAGTNIKDKPVPVPVTKNEDSVAQNIVVTQPPVEIAPTPEPTSAPTPEPTSAPIEASPTPVPSAAPVVNMEPTLEQLKLLCPAKISWGAGCGQTMPPQVHEKAVVSTSSWYLLNTNVHFGGTAQFLCSASGWVFKGGTCAPAPWVEEGIPNLLVNAPGGIYQNCVNQIYPSTVFQDQTLTWAGCCYRLKRVCAVEGYSQLNTLTCVK